MKIFHKTSLTAFLLSCSLSVSAIPAYPGLQKITLADGAEVTCRLVGDEYGHWFITTDGRALDLDAKGQWQWLSDADIEVRQQQRSQSRAEAFGKRAIPPHLLSNNDDSGRITNFPTIGEVRGLVILVDFEDIKFQEGHDSLRYTRQLNEVDFSDDGATGSARDYFIGQSYGDFTPRFDVVGPVKLPHNESYYGANQMNQDINPEQMVIDACLLAHDSLNVDFSIYDFDQDDIVDFVFIIYAGYGENYGAPSSTIWPHMSQLLPRGKQLTLDGKTFDLYACSCELIGNTGNKIDGIGALCHEFGHVLGLPDMYNTVNSHSIQLGAWDIMDSGGYNNNSRTPPSYTGFERYCLGWIELTDLTEAADSIIVPEINESRMCYRIPTKTGKPGEYFTLENHQMQGWDAYHPACGLMIIHIDYDENLWRANNVNSGTYPHYDLMEADGSQGAPTRTDLYPIEGNNMFTDYSTPNSLAWDKTPTERGVDHIVQHDDGNISIRFMLDRLTRPVVYDVTEITDSSFVAVWESVEGAIGYRIDLQEVLPDSLNPIILDEDFSGFEEGNYPIANNTDISSSLDSYTQNPGWSGSHCYQAGGYLRIGAYGQSGTLVSPDLTTSQPHNLTMLYTASSYPGKTVSYTLTLKNAETGEVICDTTLKADRNIATDILYFENVPEMVSFSFETFKERLYLDEVRLASGIFDSLEVRTMGPASWSVDSIAPLLDDDDLQVESQRCLITHLAPKRSYHFQVIALDEEPMRSSLPSEDVCITTLSQSENGIEPVHTLPRNFAPLSFHDLYGRRINSTNGRGLYISNGRTYYLLSPSTHH
ncbi:MAG: M6 family metalloprotease domain-containing protein [Bacteroidales bacterium]|nr:M6 family metalloprotease domain-containing protein [Bacteroidales bacterium]